MHSKNSNGPVKSVKPDPNKEYIFSAWVKTISGDPLMAVQILDGGEHMRGVGARVSDLAKTWPSKDWQYVEYRLKPQHMEGISKHDISLNIWIGTNAPGTPNRIISDCFVDDIRFYPADAMVTTTYYDGIHSAPIVSVDANNNPSDRITYDGFGRPVKWEKIKNPAKGVGESGFSKVLRTKEYHLQGDCRGSVYYNGFEKETDNDFTSNANVFPSRVEGGYKSTYCNKIPNVGVLPLPNPNSYKGKMGQVTGYYKTNLGPNPKVYMLYTIQYGRTSATAKETEATYLQFSALEWKPFGAFFDFTNLPPEATIADFRIVVDCPDAKVGAHFWIDEINICTFD